MLKILHVGCGRISDAWLSNLIRYDDIFICSIIDINPDAAREKAQKYHLECPVYSDATEAIIKHKPDIVIDNTVPSERLKLAKASMANGAHVFSEKPLADTIENAKEIIKLSEEYDRNFFVMQNRRYNTGMFSYRKALQSGLVGEIGYLSAEFFRDPHFGGFRDEMASPLLIDMAIHTFDQARFLLGKDPVSVICREYNPGWSWYKGNASAVCIFTFIDGIIFNYTGSWCAPGHKTSWDSDWRAGGSKGTALWNGQDKPTAGISETAGESRHPGNISIEVEEIVCDKTGHEGCINEMIESIKQGKQSQTNCRDNIKSLAMVFAAVKSNNENREVQIKEILED